VGSEGGVAGGHSALRALLGEAGLSNAALAHAVVTAGAEEGVHVGTNTTSVRRMLDGCQPRWPVPRLVAKVLCRQLHHEISVTDWGFADRSLASGDLHDGLRCLGTLDGTLHTVVELSGRDMCPRRGRASVLAGWIHGSRCRPAFAGAALLHPDPQPGHERGRSAICGSCATPHEPPYCPDWARDDHRT
jgi:hypothetical protein